MERPSTISVTGLVAVFALAIASSLCAQEDPVLPGTFEVTEDGFSVSHPEDWSADYYAGLPELRNASAEHAGEAGPELASRIRIYVDRRTDHAEALERLKDIIIEYRDPTYMTTLRVDGWPAIQRRQITNAARPSLPLSSDERSHLRLTTAIAAGDRVIRLETHLPPGTFGEAAEDLADTVEAIGRSVRTSFATQRVDQVDQDLEELRDWEVNNVTTLEMYQPPERPAAHPDLIPIDELPDEFSIPDRTTSPGEQTVRGDLNGDGIADLSDTAYLLRWLVGEGPAPVPSGCGAPDESGDLNGDRRLDISDALYLVRYLFEDGPAPFCRGGWTDHLAGDGGAAGALVANQRVNNGAGTDAEIEVTTSIDGMDIVIGNNGRDYSFSNDGGVTFTTSAVNLGFPANGDPSLAFSAGGSFYFAFIGYPDGTPAALNVNGCSTGIAVSTDRGATFPFLRHAAFCPNTGAVCFPDQEHIAADRFNTAGGGGDLVYSVWRNFAPNNPGMETSCRTQNWVSGSAGSTPMIICSSDSGANWTAPTALNSAGDFPRVTVGQDGFVYVVYRSGGNILLDVYNPCDAGLGLQFSSTVVTGVNDVVCPVSGLDRCNNGNNLSSHMVAVDDTDPAHIYVAFASNTGAGNEDIFVKDSTDGGVTWPVARIVRVNSSATGRRFMPWVSAMDGAAAVTWYDRRAATAGNNDVTDFYCGVAYLSPEGDLVAGDEMKISKVPDSHCASGWPSAPRSTNDSESCSVQPQLAGRCQQAATPAPGDSNLPCDFSDGGCPPGESCFTGGGGPKYGDYNGNAAAVGKLFCTWASATSPPEITPASTDIDVFLTVKALNIPGLPQITIPGPPEIDDTCVGETSTATLYICNTGSANLMVGSITSDDPQFSVTLPSSGYPVIISPDFCFPFQLNFTPTGTGPQSATLTIPNNDPDQGGETLVEVTALGTEPEISTLIADEGDFGDVCIGTFRDLDLTINNSGGCDLQLQDLASSSTEFQVASDMTFPLLVHSGDSLRVPIRLAPTTLGPKAADITVTTDDPVNPMKVVPVSGNTPPGDIRVTGSTEFGDVCAEELAEKTISICNVGLCTLNVTSVAFDPPCDDFELINNPFPSPVSHDFCLDVVIRFTPTSVGPKMCTLVIMSDDPDEPIVSLEVTGNTPAPMIDVPPDQAFAPTVVTSFAPCSTAVPFPISNIGQCNLPITNIEITLNDSEYSLRGLPSFPIVLEPGHIAGEGDLRIVFAPEELGRERAGEISVTYISDPILGTETTETRQLCGEGVRTGARLLVTDGGVAVDEVEKIQLLRINANRNRTANELDTVDVLHDVGVQSVNPSAPCVPFQFHREWGTVSNVSQLLPGFYQVSVTIRNGGPPRTLIHGFNVDTCDFNQTILVEF